MRDTRIDIIRGYALITILINHFAWFCWRLGMQGPAVPTLTSHGYSSAAEIFFLMSGYMVGLVYLKKPGYRPKLLARAWLLYRVNALTFLCVLAICVFTDTSIHALTSVSFTFDNPIQGVFSFLVFAQAPDLLDILQVYIVLMLVAAIAGRAIEQWPFVAIGASAALYIATQFFPELNLPGGTPGGDWRWNLNPFAFQLLFFVGMAGGTFAVHRSLFAWLEADRRRILAALVLLLVVSLGYRTDVFHARDTAWATKTNLGALRLLHFSIVLGAVASVIVLTKSLHHTLVFRGIAAIGRQSLYCFASSIVLTYIATGVWVALGMSWGHYMWLNAALLGGVYYVSLTYEGHLSRTNRRLPVDRPEVPTVVADNISTRRAD